MYSFNMALAGLLIGSVLTLVFHPLVGVHQNKIAQCEKSLPRDQHCVITAVPKYKDDSK